MTSKFCVVGLLVGCSTLPGCYSGSSDSAVGSRPVDNAYEEEQIERLEDWLGDDYPASDRHAELVDAYRQYDQLATLVRDARLVELREGLPHPVWEHDLLEQELSEEETVHLRGFDYYATPIQVRPSDAKELAKLYASCGNLFPYCGPKNCGGYHPDWCLVWEHEGTEVEVELCFGCSESRTYSGDLEMWNDANDSQFKDILGKYQTNRPAR